MTETRREDPTWGEIVWGQFRRRRLASWALVGVVGLLLQAVLVPALASNKPFLWRVGDGPLQSPWLSALYDRNFYENAIDIVFNTLLFPGLLLAAPVAVIYRRTAGAPRAVRARLRGRALRGALAVYLLTLGGILAFPQQTPKEVYPEREAALLAAGTPVLAVYPPLPYSARDTDLEAVRAPMSARHPLGTDNAGRDVLTRLLYGTRISLTIGVFAVALYCTLGTVIGAIAGYYGGRVDMGIQRIIEVVMCIPSTFLILSVAAFIEQRSIFHIMGIIAAVTWTGPARLVRAEVLRLRNLDFVSAARAAGFGEAALIFREILPNALAPVLVAATFGVAGAILTESTMSFLGLGDITVPSWGQILNVGRTTGLWPLILAPGFAIFLTVGLLNLVGEGVRDALDPKLRR